MRIVCCLHCRPVPSTMYHVLSMYHACLHARLSCRVDDMMNEGHHHHRHHQCSSSSSSRDSQKAHSLSLTWVSRRSFSPSVLGFFTISARLSVRNQPAKRRLVAGCVVASLFLRFSGSAGLPSSRPRLGHSHAVALWRLRTLAGSCACDRAFPVATAELPKETNTFWKSSASLAGCAPIPTCTDTL